MRDAAAMDDAPDRRGTWSEKWDRWADRPDVLPMWVADMDLPAPPCVIEALRARLDHGVLGYTHTPPAFAEALCAWLGARHGWEPRPEWVQAATGMVVAMNTSARILGKPGDGGLVMTPIYPPFLRAPGLAGRRCLQVPLAEGADGFAIDWTAMEAAIAQGATTLWLCSPHNPTGRVWTRAELEKLAAFALTHGLSVVSDEAWMDLVLEPGCRHIPFASIAPELAARTVTIVAPSKTFNLPGLSCAAVIIPDPALRRAYREAGMGMTPWPNAMGLIAAVAAWREGGPWLDGLLAQLRGNRDAAVAGVRGAGLRCHPPQATYLQWIDCRDRWTEPAAACLAAGLGLSDGADFAAPGWLRLNYGCPRTTLDEGLRRLARA